MGCDGGTIPKRHELVKTAKRPEQRDKDMERKAKWTTCCITQQPLEEPIVACELGRLYNKESLLEFLLDRTICETASHVRNLKDIKTLKLTPNTGFDNKLNGTAKEYYDTQAANFVCPIVGLEMNGKYKFCLLWSCSCVVSERAMKEVEADTCHSCGSKFEKEDVIILNAEGDDLVAMEEKMKNRREKAKALRKEKKDKKNDKRKSESKEVNIGKTKDGFAIPKPLEPPAKKKSKTSETIEKKNGDHALSLKAEANGHSIKDQKKSSKDKTDVSGHSLKQKKKASKQQTETKIDVTQSKVYKSLFTSSEKSKNRSKDQSAHWVTYNPYHL